MGKSLESESEAELLVNIGQALVGIRTYLIPSPSTQPADLVDDVRVVLNKYYTEGKIKLYLKTLERFELKKYAKELKKNYQKLRKIAELD